MLLLFGIIIADFFRRRFHLKITEKKADVSDTIIIGKYSNWKFENSSEIELTSDIIKNDA